VPLHTNVFVEACNLQICFTIYQWLTKLLSIRLELFISPKCSEDVFNFSRNKQMIPIVLFLTCTGLTLETQALFILTTSELRM